MKVHKVLNNNAVVCKGNNDESYIVTGKGVAFHKRPGDQLDESSVKKIYTLADESLSSKFQQIVSQIPLKYINVADQIISYGKRYLNRPINEIIYISLPDHIYGSVQLYSKGIKLHNKLLFDIKRIYPKEFKVGRMAIKKISAEFKVDFLEDEAAFIAQHFVNAELGNQINDIPNMTEIIDGILNIVKFEFGIVYDENSISYERFLTHLKFFCYRMQSNQAEDYSANEMLPILIKKFPKSNHCVNKISDMLKLNYHYCLYDDERMYLIMHINRILQESL